MCHNFVGVVVENIQLVVDLFLNRFRLNEASIVWRINSKFTWREREDLSTNIEVAHSEILFPLFDPYGYNKSV